MGPSNPDKKTNDPAVDLVVGNRLIEVKAGATALRGVRASLMGLAYATAARPGSEGFLVLPDVAVTRARLEHEWRLASTVFRPQLLDRLRLCIPQGDHFIGLPRDPEPEAQRVLARVVAHLHEGVGRGAVRRHASFVVFKVLLHHWLTSGEPVTNEWLSRASGFSYPTVAGVLRGLGGLVERRSDRRVRLRWFAQEELARLIAGSERARDTTRFADRSGQPRDPEQHLRRLESLAPPGVAIGGVLGARHRFPGLDLAGVPRLDLSRHCARAPLDTRFIQELDPALQRAEDPFEPAAVVVHAVRHADPFFVPRAGGLRWADPVECLLDLHEARLDSQAAELLEALRRDRPGTR